MAKNDKEKPEFYKMKQFKFWCQKVLPCVYDESLSYYELLCKVVDYINQLVANDKVIQEYIENWDTDLQEIYDMLDDLQAEIDRYAHGELIPQYVLALQEFIDEHLEGIVGRIVKYVSFGITEDGHFCALIPKTWDFIQFETIIDPTSELYGHLILRW